MPHKCTKCGREYNDGSTEILKGCASCGGKKFLYVKQDQLNEDVLDEKSIDEIAVESNEEILEVVEPKKKKEIEMYDRVETIRIVSPGSYELNLEKMAHRPDVDDKGRTEKERPEEIIFSIFIDRITPHFGQPGEKIVWSAGEILVLVCINRTIPPHITLRSTITRYG